MSLPRPTMRHRSGIDPFAGPPTKAEAKRARKRETRRAVKRMKATNPKPPAAGECWWCGGPFTHEAPRTMDHLIPRSQGGLMGDNLVPSCGPCNWNRGVIDFEVWACLVCEVMVADPEIKPSYVGRTAASLYRSRTTRGTL